MHVTMEIVQLLIQVVHVAVSRLRAMRHMRSTTTINTMTRILGHAISRVSQKSPPQIHQPVPANFLLGCSQQLLRPQHLMWHHSTELLYTLYLFQWWWCWVAGFCNYNIHQSVLLAFYPCTEKLVVVVVVVLVLVSTPDSS